MNRYIVIDLKKNIIYSTSDLISITKKNGFDKFGCTVTCRDKIDLIREIENELNELKNLYWRGENYE